MMTDQQFSVLELSPEVWLVTNAAGWTDALMDARFTGAHARDRAYAYAHWLNEHETVHQRVDALKTELDRAIDDLRNLREQVLPTVR